MPYIPKEEITLLKERMKGRWFAYFEACVPDLDEAITDHGSHVPCPMHGGSDGFRLFEDADMTGGGVCNSCGAYSDGIALAMAINDWEFLKAVESIRTWLEDGGDVEDFDDSDVKPEKRTEENKEVIINPFALDYINRIVRYAKNNHPRLKKYFESRGLSHDPPDTLGIIFNEKYQDQDEILRLPAMVALFENPEGDTVVVHRTYLDPEGDGKADVEKPKKFSTVLYPGATRGGAIRLRPYSNGYMGIAEGIETAEAVYQATKIPTWAAGNAINLSAFTPPDDVIKLCIWADNDSHDVGQKAAEKLALRLKDRKIQVKIFVPPDTDTDWLDVLLTYGPDRLFKIAKKTGYALQ